MIKSYSKIPSTHRKTLKKKLDDILNVSLVERRMKKFNNCKKTYESFIFEKNQNYSTIKLSTFFIAKEKMHQTLSKKAFISDQK